MQHVIFGDFFSEDSLISKAEQHRKKREKKWGGEKERERVSPSTAGLLPTWLISLIQTKARGETYSRSFTWVARIQILAPCFAAFPGTLAEC